MRTPLFLAALLLVAADARAEPTTASTDAVNFPGITIDRAAHQVRVECQSLAVETPLEFFCVTNGGPEHESVLRTAAKPSHIHAGLLMLGLQPGSPVMYVASKNSWSAPFGPPVRVSVEWKDADGTLVHKPADALLKSTGKDNEPAPRKWIFAGSHQRDDGTYLADLTGYVVTLVNFEHALIDVPRLVGSANETLEFQTAPDGPKRGTSVTMILEPIGDGASVIASTEPTTQESSDADLTPEQARIAREIAALRIDWRTAMQPHEAAVKAAAETHYDFVSALRTKQAKLVEEADHIEALIDELDRTYAEMTTPKP